MPVNRITYHDIKFALGVLDETSRLGAIVIPKELEQLRHKLRGEILVGSEPRKPGSGNVFWLEAHSKRLLLRILKSQSVERAFSRSEKQLLLLKRYLSRMPIARPNVKTRVSPITPADIVRGVEEIWRREPESRDWPSSAVRSAVQVWWWGFGEFSVLTRSMEREGFFEELRGINPRVADVLSGGTSKPKKRKPGKGKAAPDDIASATLRLAERQSGLAKASYRRRLMAISIELGLKPLTLADYFRNREGLLDKVRKVSPEAASFIGTKRSYARAVMPVSVFIERARYLMDSDFAGGILDKFCAIDGGECSHHPNLYRRFMNTDFSIEVFRADPEVAYWVHPTQADLVRMYLELKEAGVRLVDPDMTSKQAFERLRKGEPIIVVPEGGVLLDSEYWKIIGEDLIDVSQLNVGVSEDSSLADAVARFRNVKIMFAGGPVGIYGRGLRGLAGSLGVSEQEIFELFGRSESSSMDDDLIDMKRVIKVYGGLIGDYMFWYEKFAGFRSLLGDRYECLLYDGLYEASKVIVNQCLEDFGVVEDAVKTAVVSHLRGEWGRLISERPVLGDDRRAHLLESASESGDGWDPSVGVQLSCEQASVFDAVSAAMSIVGITNVTPAKIAGR